MPDIVVEHCLFDSLDCRHIWDVQKTKDRFLLFIGSQGEYFNMIGSNIVKSEMRMTWKSFSSLETVLFLIYITR